MTAMKRILVFVSALFGIMAMSSAAVVNVVASSSDLKAIADYIGGNYVSAKSIVTGKDNPHFVEVLPNYMVMVSKADIYFKLGLGLDFWAQPIIDGSRNNKLVVVDCSEGIEVLGKPVGQVNASMGDVHPQGNPHYQLDPANGLVIARNIEKGLAQVDPANAGSYEAALKRFETELGSKIEIWKKEAEPLRGMEIVTYHDSWPYLFHAFGIKVVAFIEPKPGIEPTAGHTAELITLIKARGIKVIGKEPYYSDRAPRALAAATGAKVVDLPPSVGGAEGADDYFSLFEVLISRLTSAIRNEP
jgi:zinc/manganese transport system substrate-binding protein